MEQKKMALSNAIILTSILSVLIIALQIIGVFTIHLEDFTIALALIPICLGAFYGGPYVGAILGGVFAVTVLCTPSTWPILKADPFATLVVVLAKGIGAGCLAGLSYVFLTRVNKVFAAFAGATVCPLVNTLFFMGGGVVFLTDDVAELTNGGYAGIKGAIYWLWSIAADNFIFEFALTIMIATLVFLAIESVKYYVNKKYLKSKKHHHHRRPHRTSQHSSH